MNGRWLVVADLASVLTDLTARFRIRRSAGLTSWRHFGTLSPVSKNPPFFTFEQISLGKKLYEKITAGYYRD